MSRLLKIEDFESFEQVKSFGSEDVNIAVLKTVSALDERLQIEPFIRASIYDFNDTPHGPAE